MNRHEIKVDERRCVGCGLCAQDCPANYIRVIGGKAEIAAQDCIKCGHCVAICPKNAVSVTGFDRPPKEIPERAALEPERLLAAIETRRSVRQFQNKDIPAEIIDLVIEAGRLTPSAENKQDVSYIVLQDKKAEFERTAVRFFKRLKPIVGLFKRGVRRAVIDEHFFFKKAPAAIFLVSKDKVSASLAAANMALMAEAQSLGVLYSGFSAIAANRSGKLKRLLGLKRGERVVTVLVLGYPGVKYCRVPQRESARVRRV